MSRVRIGALVLALMGLTVDARSQDFSATGALSLASVRLRREVLDAATEATGLGVGGSASVEVWRTALELRYLQSPLEAGGAKQDFVEGELLLAIRLMPWVALRAGPRIRALVTELGTERWVFWEGRVRGNARLIGRKVGAYAEAWTVLGGTTNVDEPFNQGLGMEGALELRLFGAFSSAVGYRFDRGTHLGGTRTDIAEYLFLQMRLGSP